MNELKQLQFIQRWEVTGITINVSAVAKMLGVSWKTAKKKISGTSNQNIRKKKESKLSIFTSIIDEKVDKYSCTAKSIYLFIKKRGYMGSYTLVKDYVKVHKKDMYKKACLRVETTPGLQAQVDWKEEMKLISKHGEVFQFNLFLYILPYSKYRYIELTLDRTQITLFKCLVSSFKFTSGVPEEIWFDNMKTVVDSHNFNTGEVKFNDAFMTFSKDIQFKPIACRPYRPQTKGSVENLAKLVDRLKVYNNEFENFEDLIIIVNEFNKEINNEVSQATFKTPNELYQIEKEHLHPIVNQNILDTYESAITRIVSNESMINYNYRKYSVPVDLIGKTVEIKVLDNKIYIYYNKKLITNHDIIENTNLNYKKDHLVQIMKSDVYKHKSDKEIEELAEKRLKGYDKYGKTE